MCPFKLSSPLAARRYVKEFMGIFTEEGRKFVKITHERETRAGREIMEMQTGEKMTNTPKVQIIPTPTIITQQQSQTQPQAPPSTSITSPPPPALVATPAAALKLAAGPPRIITARPSPGQVMVLAQVKQDAGNQVIKNLLNQPNAPMTQTMVNGLTTPEVQTVYLQVDNSNLIHMTGATVPNLQVSLLPRVLLILINLSLVPAINCNTRDSDYASNLHDECANSDSSAGDSRQKASGHVVHIQRDFFD